MSEPHQRELEAALRLGPGLTPDPRDAEIARLRAEVADMLHLLTMANDNHDQARAEMAEMQDDLDAAYRLLGLAPYPLTA